MLTAKLLGSASLVLLLMPVGLYGQTDTSGDPPEHVPLRLGPVALAPAVTVSNFGWDSNVSLQPTDGRPEGDVTGAARPEVRSWLRVGPARLRGRSALGFNYLQQHPSERSVDAEHEGRLDLRLVHLTPYVSGRWVSARERFGFEIDERIRRHEDTRTAGLEIRLTPRTSVDVAARRSRLEFDRSSGFRDDSFYYFADYTSHGTAVALRQELTPITSLAVTVDRHRERFELAPDRNSRSFGISAGLEFNPLAVISGTAYVGWVRVKLDTPGIPSFGGLAASVNLAYTLFGATRFGVEAARDVSYSAIRGQRAYLFTGGIASVTHRLNETWEVGARTGRHYQTYGLFDSPVPGGNQLGSAAAAVYQEIVMEYRADVGYRVGPDTRVGFAVARQNRRANIGSGREYVRTVAGISVSYRF